MDNNVKQTEPDYQAAGRASLVKGSAWMTAGSVFSRFLGAIYIIPWNAWMATSLANALFARGYNIYSFFLIVSTAGIPGAISKQIAHYNALNEYSTGNKLFKQGLKIMALTGIITAALMYFAAPAIAQIFGDGDPHLIPVLKALSAALLIIPVMSISRGYFQGYNQMAPSAISQFVEQVGRVLYMLAATFVIMKVQKGSYVGAVVQSTFAAFIGAVCGLVILGVYFVKQLPRLQKLARGSRTNNQAEQQNFFFEIWGQALPFIILDAGIIIFQLFDQATFDFMMKTFYRLSKETLDSLYALFSFNANKLIMITVSLATSMSVTAVPLLSAAFSRRDRQNVRVQIANTLQLFLLVMIPASLGMYAVARPLYILFYGYDRIGIYVLQFNSIVAILMGLFTVLSSILQGVYQNRLAIRYFLVGLIAKMIMQYPLIWLLGVFGPLAATAVGMTVSCFLMLKLLMLKFDFSLGQTINRTCGMLCLAVLMLVGVMLVDHVGYHMVPTLSRGFAFSMLLLEVFIGALIYGYLLLRTHLGERILGQRVAHLRQSLHIK